MSDPLSSHTGRSGAVLEVAPLNTQVRARSVNRASAPQEWYWALSSRNGFEPDSAQVHAVQFLQRLYEQLLEFKAYRQKPFVKTFGKKPPPRGLYLYGGVGRGKSLLMDMFYNNLPYKRKRRVHFHQFMREVHHRLSDLQSEADPLRSVALDIAAQTRLLCFDEFHVNDIADAMLLGRLFGELIQRGVVLVITSNYAPDELYRNGLQRERFLPAIALLWRALEVVNVDGGVDYRLRRLERMQTYHTPLGETAESSLDQAFATLCPDCGTASVIVVNGRKIPVKRVAAGAVWFDFAALCEGPRSQLDYLEIAREFHTVLLSNVPSMGADQSEAARRFTWLVDILYEHKVKLLLSAQAQPGELYRGGTRRDEFERTVSRLLEMQSRDYLGIAHGP
jgi:cell division protein ZapE